MAASEEEVKRRKARALGILEKDDNDAVAWLLIHLAQAIEQRAAGKAESYDLGYVRTHLDTFSEGSAAAAVHKEP